MKKAAGIIISLAISGLLYFGSESAHDFAYYLLIAMMILVWIVILCGSLDGEAARNIADKWWLNVPPEIISIMALIVTGHPLTAAISLISSAAVLSLAFSQIKKEANK